jgi:hypothetical protein
MFAKDEDMQVTQEPDGTIRMVEKVVPQDLLNMKIGHISFDDEQKRGHGMFSPPLVLSFIIAAPEVRAFLRDNSIGLTRHVINGPVDPRTIVSGGLNNVTLSQALHHTLKTFRGLWVYEECPGNKGNKRIVDFSFYQYWE